MENRNVVINKYFNFSCSICVFSVVLILSMGELLLAVEEKADTFKPRYATVAANNINIRSGAGVNFEILGQLNKANGAVVIGEQGDWYKIKLPPWALSFVHKNYVDEGIVVGDNLYIRAGCGTNFNVIGVLHQGEAVNILPPEQKDNWLRITPTRNCSGWVKKEYLLLTNIEFQPSDSLPSFFAQKTQEQVGAYGTIDDLGKVYGRQGTHKLIKDEKIIYYLKSDNINLNRYVYQKVWVTGRLIDLPCYPYPVMYVEQVKEIRPR